MKYSHKLSDAVHILAYVYIYADGDLSSKAIASSVETNQSMVRRMMSNLVRAGLLNSQPGKVELSLAKAPQDISLLDVYLAIEDNHNFLHIDDKTNPLCIVGGNIQETLNDVYSKIQKDAEASMSEHSLQEIIDQILTLEKNKNR
ncbi:Rrf2 family transcriptional regulator [Weissella koreensis]|uniref:Rrf2 family transcriptional regulator n=1 Tax=Weissella koreensis TaxID=165096 RepID=A0A7H1MLR9_9LACO|nr:Rrf2 family transcriptional regulator [Weissella koreensis]AVH75201.1 Rrf2 family transcriptional regulator [Weissella koreensis]EJF33616.1 Rrf2 family transcriptional regulator [Weissella koreensis KCTC 3621]QGN20426.1 transcriptional regulator [Weissella koreensis]QNT64405.1 Rrf2 family transcriptional regulator [Weissella koreensis]